MKIDDISTLAKTIFPFVMIFKVQAAEEEERRNEKRKKK